MVEEIIETQSFAEVQEIDNRRIMMEAIDQQISTQNDNLTTINEQLDTISSIVTDAQPSNIDLTEITDKIDEIDTTIINVQTQNILETLNNQQNQINSIEDKLNLILNKIDEMKE